MVATSVYPRRLSRHGQSRPAASVRRQWRLPWPAGRVEAVALAGTAAGLLLALAGTLTVAAGVPPWPRFWATTFFTLLFWPVGLALAGRLLGVRAQVALAGALLAATAGQQLQRATEPRLPLPMGVRWAATLAHPGDAVRQRILLPADDDPAWARAWRNATRAAVTVCTESAVAPDAGLMVSLNGSAPLALAPLSRTGPPQDTGWYEVPLTRELVRGTRVLLVEVSRTGEGGPPAAVCGGRDDPRRPGAGGAARRVGGSSGVWLTDGLADYPLPAVNGRQLPGRYYIEVRFFTKDGLPHAGIWY